MKEILFLLKNDKVVGIASGLSLVSFCFVAILVGFTWQHLAPYIPIFLKLPWGYDRVGTKLEIIYPLCVWLGEIVIYVIVLRPVYIRVVLLGRFLAFSLMITSLGFLIFFVQIVRIGV